MMTKATSPPAPPRSSSEYLERNPTWHLEDSSWKAERIAAIVSDNGLSPASICDLGCGAGAVLEGVSEALEPAEGAVGYEVSPDAYAMARERERAGLSFVIGDGDDDRHFEMMLCIDVFEHVEDYPQFLRRIRTKADRSVFHIPLDLSVQSVARAGRLLRSRSQLGHIHYFSRDLAIAALDEAGYRVIDERYTSGAIDLPSRGLASRLARVPRVIGRRLAPHASARWLGGFSLLVLAENG